MILNSADIPNLYASDEKGEIMDKIQGVAKAEQVWTMKIESWNLPIAVDVNDDLQILSVVSEEHSWRCFGTFPCLSLVYGTILSL